MTTKAYANKVVVAVQSARTRDPDNIGPKFGMWCINKPYSVIEVAEYLGVSRMTVYKWFKGRMLVADRYHAKIQDLMRM